MNTHVTLAAGVIFMVTGVLFSAVALYLKSPKAVEKAAISSIAGTIFYIIGALTFVTGLLAVLFRTELSKTALQAGFLVYLVILSVIFFIFTTMLKDSTKK